MVLSTSKTELSNTRHRPIGIVQGLADAFILMDIPFHSEDAKIVNKKIFETIYYAAIVESCALAKKHGSYSTFADSPASRGILQFDMWSDDKHVSPCGYNWDKVKEDIKVNGLRNSLLVAPIQPLQLVRFWVIMNVLSLTGNIYSRRTGAGEFVMANKYLIRELIDLNLWNEEIKNNIIEKKVVFNIFLLYQKKEEI